ncbi:MAG: ankyrin repeat domain-containing protein [Pseudomonadota bacterium]
MLRGLLTVPAILLVCAAAALLLTGSVLYGQPKERSAALVDAAERGDISAVKLLVGKGANANATTDSGGTALLAMTGTTGGSLEELD